MDGIEPLHGRRPADRRRTALLPLHSSVEVVRLGQKGRKPVEVHGAGPGRCRTGILGEGVGVHQGSVASIPGPAPPAPGSRSDLPPRDRSHERGESELPLIQGLPGLLMGGHKIREDTFCLQGLRQGPPGSAGSAGRSAPCSSMARRRRSRFMPCHWPAPREASRRRRGVVVEGLQADPQGDTRAALSTCSRPGWPEGPEDEPCRSAPHGNPQGDPQRVSSERFSVGLIPGRWFSSRISVPSLRTLAEWSAGSSSSRMFPGQECLIRRWSAPSGEAIWGAPPGPRAGPRSDGH